MSWNDKIKLLVYHDALNDLCKTVYGKNHAQLFKGKQIKRTINKLENAGLMLTEDEKHVISNG